MKRNLQPHVKKNSSNLLYMFFSFLIIGAMWFIQAPQVNAEKEYSAVVIVDTTLNVRDAPNIDGDIIGSLLGGVEIAVHSEQAGWAEIRFEDRQAWVSATYLQKDGTPTAISPDSSAENSPSPPMNVPVDELISKSYELNGQAPQPEETVAPPPSNEVKPVNPSGSGEDKGAVSKPGSGLEIVNTGGSSSNSNSTPTNLGGAATMEIGYVIADALRLREEPNLNGEIMTLLPYNTSVEIKGKTNDGWLEVVAPDGKKGWVSAEYIERSEISNTGASKPKDQSLKGKRILIDPGHGGKDSGTIGIKHQTYEKHLTLSTSLLIATMLRNAGAEVILTRANDSYVELSDRVATSEKENPDVYISVHYDYGTKNSSGVISFYYSESRDRLLANTVQKNLVESTGMRDSGVRKGNFYVLRENTRPSILLELGYVSNPEEEELVRTREYQEKVALGIVKGLQEYFAK